MTIRYVELSLGTRLSLRKLWSLAGFAQTYFFTFNGSCVPGQEPSLAHWAAEILVVFNQRTRDTVANRPGLARITTAAHGDL